MPPAHHGPTVISPAADAGSSAVASQLVSSRPIDLDWDALDTAARTRVRSPRRAGPDLPRLHRRRAVRRVAAPGAPRAPAGGLFGNPHSSSPASRTSTQFADAARRAILAFVNASPDDYTVVFTANASARAQAGRRGVPVHAGEPLPADHGQPQLGQRHPAVRAIARRRGHLPAAARARPSTGRG